MRANNTIRAALLVAGCACAMPFGAPVVAEEGRGLVRSPEPGWPQWRGPARDAISGETGLLPTWPEAGPPLRWKLDAIGHGWSSPVLSRDTLYVTGDTGDDLAILAFDLDGKPRWQARNGAAWKGSWPGARACPVLAGGRLYHMNAHGRVACLDAATGREVWSVDVAARFEATIHTWAMSENLLVDGPRLIVSPVGKKALMAALDRDTGATVWTAEPIEGDQPSYCSPVLVRQAGRRMLFNCSTHHAWAVDADTGRRLWTLPFHGRWGVTTSTPVWDAGRLFLAAPDGPEGQCLRVPDGDGIPELLWRSPVDTLTGGAIAKDGRLFAHGCKAATTLHALDWTDGRALYDFPRLAPGTSSHPSAAMVWAEGRLYAWFEYGTLALLKPAATNFEICGRADLVPTTPRPRDAWAHPVLLDGRLYVRHHETLWCLDVRRPRD